MDIDPYAKHLMDNCGNRELKFMESYTGLIFEAKPSDIVTAAYNVNRKFARDGVITIKDILSEFVSKDDMGGLMEEDLSHGWINSCFDGFIEYWLVFNVTCTEEYGDVLFVIEYYIPPCDICKQCDGDCTKEWVEWKGSRYYRPWAKGGN